MLNIRPVMHDDFWMLYAWRHDLDTEKYSLKPAPSIDVHRTWMKAAMKDVDCCLYYTEELRCPVGLCRVHKSTGETNITANPLTRKNGWGTAILQQVQSMDYKHLRAIIVVANTASVRMFLKCGFVLKSTQEIDGKPCLVLDWGSL
jgi:hypothetical protein